jgi:hypothetical protein
MSDKPIDSGGPAFPTENEGQTGNTTWRHEGMTLRDYFAAKALSGMLTTARSPCLGGLDGYEGHAAQAAYKIADAMLEARKS